MAPFSILLKVESSVCYSDLKKSLYWMYNPFDLVLLFYVY